MTNYSTLDRSSKAPKSPYTVRMECNGIPFSPRTVELSAYEATRLAEVGTLKVGKYTAQIISVEAYNEFQALQAVIAEFDHERELRNRERDFARAAGYTGEAYWETMTVAELKAAQS